MTGNNKHSTHRGGRTRDRREGVSRWGDLPLAPSRSARRVRPGGQRGAMPVPEPGIHQDHRIHRGRPPHCCRLGLSVPTQTLHTGREVQKMWQELLQGDRSVVVAGVVCRDGKVRDIEIRQTPRRGGAAACMSSGTSPSRSRPEEHLRQGHIGADRSDRGLP